MRIILLGALIANHLYAGELAEAAQAAAHVLAVADDPQAPKSWQRVSFIDTWRSYAHYYLGIVCYERNDLDGAGRHWRRVEASYRQVNLRAYHESLLGLALVAQVRGLAPEAMAYAHTAHKFGEELGNAAMLAVSTAVEVQLALAGGSTADAVRLAEAIDPARDEGVLQGLAAPRLARLGALIAAAVPRSARAGPAARRHLFAPGRACTQHAPGDPDSGPAGAGPASAG